MTALPPEVFMALVPCPSCGLLRTVDDAGAVACPVCGWKPGDPVVAAVEEPAPPPPPLPSPEVVVTPEPRRWQNWGLVGGLAVVGGAVLVGMLVWSVDRPPEPQSENNSPSPPVAESPPGPAPAFPPEVEVAPPPREVERPGFGVIPVVIPLPVPGPPAPSVVRLNHADEEFRIDRLGDRNRVKLVGKVKKLLIYGLNDGAVIDATELSVETVNVYGVVDNGSALLVKSPHAAVTFRATSRIAGGSRVVLDVGFGSVTFAYAGAGEGAPIVGGSNVTIVARQVHLGGIRDEGTTVSVTVMPPGNFRFHSLAGGARLHYKLSDPADPLPRLIPGEVRGGAEFKQLQ